MNKIFENVYQEGITCYYLPPWSCDSKLCKVCGSYMTVERNFEGHSSHAAVVSDRKGVYDFFTCPYIKDGWHKRLLSLYTERNDNYNEYINHIYTKEMQQILESKKD